MVERAKGQQTLQEATPYRSLLEGWFRENHWEAEGYGALHAIDSHFQTGKTVPIKELVVLPGARHTMGDTYGEHKRNDFFVRHLMGKAPPKWSELK